MFCLQLADILTRFFSHPRAEVKQSVKMTSTFIGTTPGGGGPSLVSSEQRVRLTLTHCSPGKDTLPPMEKLARVVYHIPCQCGKGVRMGDTKTFRITSIGMHATRGTQGILPWSIRTLGCWIGPLDLSSCW